MQPKGGGRRAACSKRACADHSHSPAQCKDRFQSELYFFFLLRKNSDRVDVADVTDNQGRLRRQARCPAAISQLQIKPRLLDEICSEVLKLGLDRRKTQAV